MQAKLAKHALILGALTAIGPMAIDMYLPAFPVIAADLHTHPGAVQLSLVSFFIALALGQSIYGPLSDMFGRKRPLYVGLLLYMGAAIGCAFATSVPQLVVLRFFQGLGGCAGMVISRAVVRDLHSGQDAVRLFSLILMVMGVAPVVAPLAGSTLVEYYSWHSIFWVGAAFSGLCLLMIALFLPETQPKEQRSAGGFAQTMRGYGMLIRDFHFVGIVAMSGFAQAGLFAYLAASSSVFIDVHGVSPRAFSIIIAMNAIGLIGTAQFNARLIRKFGAEQLIRTATLIYAVAAVTLLALSVMDLERLWVLMVLLFICFSCMGVVLPSSTMLALEPHGEIAGTASALMGTLQFAFGAGTTAIVSALYNDTSLPLIGAIAACGTGAFVMSRLVLRSGDHHEVDETIAMAAGEEVI